MSRAGCKKYIKRLITDAAPNPPKSSLKRTQLPSAQIERPQNTISKSCRRRWRCRRSGQQVTSPTCLRCITKEGAYMTVRSSQVAINPCAADRSCPAGGISLSARSERTSRCETDAPLERSAARPMLAGEQELSRSCRWAMRKIGEAGRVFRAGKKSASHRPCALQKPASRLDQATSALTQIRASPYSRQRHISKSHDLISSPLSRRNADYHRDGPARYARRTHTA